MESDIRAKAPPGPSLAPVAGPFPEIPGRAEVEGEGGWFGVPVHPAPRDLKTGGTKQDMIFSVLHTETSSPGKAARLCFLPLRLMTSLLKRSDIKSPPWLVALTVAGKSHGSGRMRGPRTKSASEVTSSGFGPISLLAPYPDLLAPPTATTSPPGLRAAGCQWSQYRALINCLT